MATLGKIRNQGVLLIVLIGIALLIFIVTDFISNGQAMFNEQKANVGRVNGEKIKYQDFYQEMTEYTDFIKIERNSDQLTDEETDQIRQETWERIVMRKVLEADASAIGMSVPYNEFRELTIGNNPSPIIFQRQVFRDENGQFNPSLVSNLIMQLDNAEIAQQMPEQLMRFRNYWAFLEQTVKDSRLSEKYNTLLSKSLVVNSLEAKYAHENNRTSVDLVYAMKPYFLIPDSVVNVAKADVEALYKRRKAQFKQDASADIIYVVFNIRPSETDFLAIEEEMNKAKEELVTTDDVIGTTNDLSDIPFQDIFFVKNDIPADLQEFAFSGDNGIFGPFLGEDNVFKMAKIVERTIAPDSVMLSVFPITNAQSLEDLQHKTDSMMKVVNGANFMELGGQEIGWVRETYIQLPQFNKEIIDAAFKASLNVPFMVEINGIPQIFIVTEKTTPVAKVKLAVIEREVAPSRQTQQKIHQDATLFASEVTSADKMTEIAQTKGYFAIPATNIDRNAPRLGNIRGSREVIRWAFDSKVNSVSDVREFGNQLVVAGVTRKNKDGFKTLEEVTPMLETELRRDKKFELMRGDFEGKSIEQLKAENLTSDTIRNLTFGAMSAGSLGNDAPIRALAPLAEINKISAPVRGNIGAYVFEVFQKTESEQPFDAKQQIAFMNYMQNQYLFQYMVEALKKAGDVKDERYKFF